MTDPTYAVFLDAGERRTKLLRMLRRLARQAGLNNHGVAIRPIKSQQRDDLEVRTDEHARLMRDTPHLHSYLHPDARVGGILEVDGQTRAVIVGKRATNALKGKSPAMPGKASKNKAEQEQHLDLGIFRAAGKQTLDSKRNLELPLKREIDNPIDLSKPIRDITIIEIRSLLDRKNCDGVTALKILTVWVFAHESRKLGLKLSPNRKSRQEEKRLQKLQTTSDLG